MHHMNQLQSKVNVRSEDFKTNQQTMHIHFAL